MIIRFNKALLIFLLSSFGVISTYASTPIHDYSAHYKQTIGSLFRSNSVSLQQAVAHYRQVVSTKASPYLVGSLKGNFSVSPTGSAVYSIPIQVSPGTAGMTPALSVSYDSHNRNGLLGMGFKLGGLSVITRVPQNKTQNGTIHGVDYTNQDRFALNGEQLVAIHGAYGADGTEYRTYSNTFAKIVSYGGQGQGPKYFRVWSKGGQVAEYGVTDESRPLTADGSQTAKLWAVDKISDRAGNYETIHYHKIDAAGEFWPTEIDYTGNEQTGLKPYAKIVFSYTGRPDDAGTKWHAGSPNALNMRLASIQGYVGNVPTYGYGLSYETSPNTGRSRLIQLQECKGLSGAGNPCLSPITFHWRNNEEGWDYAPQYIPKAPIAINGHDFGFRIADVNGDGLADILSRYDVPEPHSNAWINKDNQWEAADQYKPPARFIWGDSDDAGSRLADITGNGLVDFVWSKDGVPWDGSGVWLNTPNGWAETKAFEPVPKPFVIDGGASDGGTRLIDVNGDGRADLVWASELFHQSGAAVWLSTPQGWTQDPGYSAISKGFVSMSGHDNGLRIADVNGDGLPDLVWASNLNHDHGQGVWLNTGSGWTPNQAGEWQLPLAFVNIKAEDKGVRLVDLNHDGLPDLIWGSDLADDSGHGVWMNTGKTWVRTQYPLDDVPEAFVYGKGTDYGARLVDVNGDGYPDLVWATALKQRPGVGVWLNINGNWVKNTPYSLPAPISNKYETDSDNGVRFIDLTGNGLPDIIMNNHDSTEAWVNKAKKLPDMLTGITDGYGKSLTIDYEPITHNDIYTKEHDAQYPVADMQGPFYVVASTSEDTDTTDPHEPANDQHVTSYHYTGAKIQHLGLGFLGFHQVSATDQSTGLKVVSTYSQDWEHHLQGKPLQVQTFKADGTLISETDNTWDLKTYGDGSLNNTYYYPYISENVKKSFSLTGGLMSTKTTQFTLDDYGNPTHIEEIDADGDSNSPNDIYSTTTDNIYSNDPVNWIIGSLTDATVTKSAPLILPITRASHFTYDAKGMLQSTVTEPGNTKLSVTKTFDRDGYGNVVSTHVSGVGIDTRTTRVKYDPNERFITQSTDALGVVTSRTYDDLSGKVLTSTDANGLTTQYAYDAFGRIINTTAPSGVQTTITYAWYQPTSMNAREQAVLTHAVYTMTTQTTDSPPVTKYFDRMGREIAEITMGFQGKVIWKTIEYDDLGRPTQISEPYFESSANIYYKQVQYDVLGRVTQTTFPDGSTNAVQYNGSFTTTINGLGQKLTKKTNCIGELQSVTDNAGHTETYLYDSYGNLTSLTDPAGHVTTMTYDSLGRKTGINDPDKGNWSYSYDVLGQLVSQTDAAGHTTTFTYDTLGHMLTRTDGAGTSTWTYGTDLSAHNVEQLIQVTGVANQHGRQASALDKIRAEKDGLVSYSKSIEYNNLSLPSDMTLQLSNTSYTTHMTYDADARLDTTTYPNHQTVKNHYDAYGYLTAVTNGDGSITYKTVLGMDEHGHVTSVEYGNGLVTTYTYDPKTQLVTDIETQAGTVLQLQRAVFHQQSSGVHHKAMQGNPAVIQSEHYVYDAIGNLKQTQDHVMGTTDNYQYDPLNRVTDYSHQVTRLRNAFGMKSYGAHRKHWIRSRQTLSARIRADQKIRARQNSSSPADHISYQYDPIGNITFKSDVGHYFYGTKAGPHAVTSILGGSSGTEEIGTYGYDADGNQTQGTLNGVSRTISYTSYQKPLEIVQGDQTVQFYYNANRNRFMRVDQTATKKTTQLYMGDYQQVTATAGSDTRNIQKVYVDGDVLIQHQEVTKSNQTTNDDEIYYLLKDHLGSVSVIVDGNGTVVKRYRYLPFGQQIDETSAVGKHRTGDKSGERSGDRSETKSQESTSGINPQQALSTLHSGSDVHPKVQRTGQLKDAPSVPITHQGFTGHETIEGVNLIHMNGRLYDPVLGRFLSADPEISHPDNIQDLNRYSYCVNNPLSLTDPSGYSWISDLFDDICHIIKAVLSNEYVRMAIGIGIAALTLGAGATWFASAMYSALWDGASTLVAGGSMGDALTNAFFGFYTAAAFVGVGNFLGEGDYASKAAAQAEKPLCERVLVHGLVGGGIQVAEGGSFVNGFLSCATTEALPLETIGGGKINQTTIAERTGAAAVIGGTVAAVTGGNFVNGAKTAAFAELFNDIRDKIRDLMVGAGDALTGDAGAHLRASSGMHGGVNENSPQYKLGHALGSAGLVAGAAEAGDGNVAEGRWTEASGMLRDAAAGKGNFGLGAATRAEAESLGKSWVGENASLSSDHNALISNDGLRQFRAPSWKPNLGRYQANFEQRLTNSGRWLGNGHLDITDY